MCHQSDLERVSILHVPINEEHLHELRLGGHYFTELNGTILSH